MAVLLLAAAAAHADSGRIVRFHVTYDMNVTGNTPLVKLNVILPPIIPGRQDIVRFDFDPEPQHMFRDAENRYAQYIFRRPKGRTTFKMVVTARLYYRGLTPSRDRVEGTPRPAAGKFTEPAEHLEVDHPKLRALARTIQAEGREETVRKIWRVVIDRLTYEEQKAHRGAAHALETGIGDCSEFSDLFVALCRAKDIPARRLSGYVAEVEEGENPGHAWAEVYFPEVGWVPFDPTWGENNGASFDMMQPVYLCLIYGGLGTEFDMEQQCQLWYAGDLPDVETDVDIEFLLPGALLATHRRNADPRPDADQPLLATEWSGYGPYAAASPNGEEFSTFTVAMAQVLNYHGLNPRGKVRYADDSGRLTIANLGRRKFGWLAQKRDIGKHVSPAHASQYLRVVSLVLQRDFESWQFGVWPWQQAYMVSRHFPCETASYSLDYYSREQLKTLLQREIDARRPVVIYLRKKDRTGYRGGLADAYRLGDGRLEVHLNLSAGGRDTGWYDFDGPVGEYDDAGFRDMMTIRPVEGEGDEASPDRRQHEAAGKLKLAQNYLNVGMKEKARGMLRDVVRDYPDTPAAEAARKLLAEED
jgi:transglutaminase-like putative cysteine protease